METTQSMPPGFRELGFFRGYVYPALFVFFVPAVSLAIFLHAESKLDADILIAIKQAFDQDKEMTQGERESSKAYFGENPVSQILRSSDPDQLALVAALPSEVHRDYLVLRWMIRLSMFCLASSFAFFVATFISVFLSAPSQNLQYWNLAIGLPVLRFFLTLQLIIQAALLVALSYYVTAIYSGIYFPQLIGIVGIIAIGSVLPVLAKLFRRSAQDVTFQGSLFKPSVAPMLFERLRELSHVVGTEPPDQVLATIDQNFFVTEQPMRVGEESISGRTLGVSASMLRTLREPEADSILAHELAHFSGNDTTYSRRISPLLARFDHFLHGLHEGALFARPVFHCAVLFRLIHELSLGRHSRERERRADRIAAETVSPEDCSSALLKCVAYAQYRARVEQNLFEFESKHADLKIADRIEAGFVGYVDVFAHEGQLGTLSSVHPFDSHPSVAERLKAWNCEITPDRVLEAFDAAPDGVWYRRIPNAECLEAEQWKAYESRFREFHEHSLAFRLLPVTDEERDLVEKTFPQAHLTSGTGQAITVDCTHVHYEDWEEPLCFGQISHFRAESKLGGPCLCLVPSDSGTSVHDLPLGKKISDREELIAILQSYHSRFMAALQYQVQQQAEQDEHFT